MYMYMYAACNEHFVLFAYAGIWQAVKMIFFAPCVCIACHYQNGINYAKDSS